MITYSLPIDFETANTEHGSKSGVQPSVGEEMEDCGDQAAAASN